MPKLSPNRTQTMLKLDYNIITGVNYYCEVVPEFPEEKPKITFTTNNIIVQKPIKKVNSPIKKFKQKYKEQTS